MKALIQRVDEASVSVSGQIIGEIQHGMLVFLGVEASDTEQTIEKLANKLLKYRIFSDPQGKMNLNIVQSEGSILLISQFTLVADTQKGNRPGFSKGASPELGKEMYQKFISYLNMHHQACEYGEFGADMKIKLINDGPVTFMLEAH